MKKVRVEEILYWYDGPLIVRGTSGVEQWLAIVIDIDQELSQWIAGFISPEDMKKLLANDLPLRDALTVCRVGPVYRGEFDGNQGDIVALQMDGDFIEESDLPVEGICLRPK